MPIRLNLILWGCLLLLLSGLWSTDIFAQSADSSKLAYPLEHSIQMDSLRQLQLEVDALARQRELAMREMMESRRKSEIINLFLTGSLIILIGALTVFIVLRTRQRRRNHQQQLRLQQEREQREQLAKLNELKSRFFTNISHEFRTPLTLILGQNQQLQAEVDNPDLDPKFDRINRNAHSLLDLINQVLNLSKLESGSIQLESKIIDLIPFLKNILFSFESLAKQNQQQLTFECEMDHLPMFIDPEKLERVFYNLLVNSLKFTPEKGKITLKLQKVSEHVHIGVIDTGIGIPEAQLPYVFERFYQAEGGENHPSPGTGIGLALAKELVELHGGILSVESEPGEGSEFWVELPLRTDGVADRPEVYESQLTPGRLQSVSTDMPSPTHDMKAGTHVLIVEDNADVRAYLNSELQVMGYRVSQANHGKEGLVQAKNEQPDLIISDVMMPQMNGFSFVQAIRSNLITSHIPIILLTAKASDESKLNGLQVGADAYLTKPFNRTELQIRVSKLIEQREHLRQRFSQAVHIRPEEVSAIPMDQAFLKQVTEIIEQNLSNEQFGVEALSSEVAMSVTHLNRKLNSIIGQSAGKLIRSMRLQRAADLIGQQTGTISEIAYDLGFSSPNNFSTAFKKQFGVSPSEYRR